MPADLVVVVALGAALAWLARRDSASWWPAVRARLLGLRTFALGLRRSHVAPVLALLVLAATLKWAAAFSAVGWEAVDLDVETGAAFERARCHRWLRSIEERGVERFLPVERACPSGGGDYEVLPGGHVRCPAHGAPP